MSESPRIRPLSEALANQIAAGEVVERPASVAKELLENALDAGARRVDIACEEGGVRSIRITDDGVGVHPEDLALALQRHATSKVATLAELETVASLGFRGEALASIASVARVRLISRRAGAEEAWSVAAEGGEPGAPEPAGHPVGTTVEVRDLFFNTPGRRKFLRAERTELAHLETVVRRLAMARPDLTLSLRHNGRQRLHFPATEDRARRLRDVLGRDFGEAAHPVALEAEGLAIHGWTRAEAGELHTFVNGRAVRDRLLQTALRRAGEDLGLEGAPAAVLHLSLPPDEVDCNVHPAKAEVRFRRGRDVHDALVHAVGEALSGAFVADSGGSAAAVAESVPEWRPEPAASGAMAGTPSPEGGGARVLAVWPEGYALLAGEPPRILDLHAARTALYRRRLGAPGKVAARRLLVPLDLTDHRVPHLWPRQGDALATLGLVAMAEGERLRVERLPDVIADTEPAGWIPELLARLEAGEDSGEALVAAAANHPAAPPTAQGVAELVRVLEAGEGMPEDATRALEAATLRGLMDRK
ncbi:DNA mismatch repair protein MutL [Thiohalospira halophila DSM 15071]|uniref:DNA mismatch repair protein MutL n=1 Tax=Thiohalospira halophila DSM 15071 TaxID=1123397 RepID=A0A1I1NHF0_9GAMM|nr:DNA mismatch repair endonuclease MutL [Thiohalospira halophila]SFC94918.1 DNA mismatch repair protein MutL [Thiohalospira halophila DSM 15071]